ncbi:MAG: protein-L-isoaspartate(D-aspartate) O-methyltransferase [Candidatus Aenigmatarchaeota archaeon]
MPLPPHTDIELAELIKSIRAAGYLKSASVEKALRAVPRHLFVPKQLTAMAYRDCPLSIGHGQTISQPSTVVAMTEALQPKRGQKILEVGAGSGWQAGLLGHIVGPKGMVWTIERIIELVHMAKHNLKAAGIKNVHVIHGDGSMGLPNHAPFDRIIVTAACPKIPPLLTTQLKPKGRMVIPVGDLYLQKMILLVRKSKDGFEQTELGNFMFVPLIGRYGFKPV